MGRRRRGAGRHQRTGAGERSQPGIADGSETAPAAAGCRDGLDQVAHRGLQHQITLLRDTDRDVANAARAEWRFSGGRRAVNPMGDDQQGSWKAGKLNEVLRTKGATTSAPSAITAPTVSTRAAAREALGRAASAPARRRRARMPNRRTTDGRARCGTRRRPARRAAPTVARSGSPGSASRTMRGAAGAFFAGTRTSRTRPRQRLRIESGRGIERRFPRRATRSPARESRRGPGRPMRHEARG